MNYVNTVTNQFSFGSEMPPGEDWRSVTTEEFNELRASGWNPTEYVKPYRVSKDTIVSRVGEAGKITELMATISGLTAEQQFFWTNFAWFWSNNPTVNGLCQQLQLDPNIILAPDPFL